MLQGSTPVPNDDRQRGTGARPVSTGGVLAGAHRKRVAPLGRMWIAGVSGDRVNPARHWKARATYAGEQTRHPAEHDRGRPLRPSELPSGLCQTTYETAAIFTGSKRFAVRLAPAAHLEGNDS